MRRRRQILVCVAGAAVVWGAGPLAVTGAAGAWAVAVGRGAVHAGTVRAGGLWGRAVELPGLGALNRGGAAGVDSVSCASPGSCAAGGSYQDRSTRNASNQAFVAVKRNGRWGKAIEVPGLRALNKGADADVSSVSCASPGSCAAGGYYQDRSGIHDGFVAAERHGRWDKAIEVPGLRALNKGVEAEVVSVSCASPGSCAAGGDYTDRSGNSQGFVAVERNGRWDKAIEVPGLGALNKGGDARVWSVACASAGNCAAGGDYSTDRHSHSQGFVAVERNGRWDKAIEVPGLGALNKAGFAEVVSVSCAPPGNCAAGGDYQDRSGKHQGFVADERNGRWGNAIEVPGLGALNKGGDAEVVSVSCASPGSCAAGGHYLSPGEFNSQGFVAVEKNDVWGPAIEVPGLGALNKGGFGDVMSVSCASAGNCAAGGGYADQQVNSHGFVAVEKNGVWGPAIEVPGLRALDKGEDAETDSVSCPPAGSCTASGDYADGAGNHQGFAT